MVVQIIEYKYDVCKNSIHPVNRQKQYNNYLKQLIGGGSASYLS